MRREWFAGDKNKEASTNGWLMLPYGDKLLVVG
jgi:hypothetical protein